MSGESVEGTSTEESTTATMSSNRRNIVYVEFEDGDRRNPQNYPLLKKWMITLMACSLAGTSGAYSSHFLIITPSLLIQHLHCTKLEAALGLGLYAVSFGVILLVASSSSKEIGRRPVYLFSSVMFTLSQVLVALAPNMGTVLAGHVLAGIFSSIEASLIGGSIADIWKPEDRGLPVTTFAFISLFSIGLRSVIGDAIQSCLRWRWVQWINVMFSTCSVILVVFVLSETRSSIILIQIARSQCKLTGNNIYKAKDETGKKGPWSLIKTSCSRPLYFLLTEPIVQSFSVWLGLAWGIAHCLLVAATPIFQMVYRFDIQQTGHVYAALSMGTVIGFLANVCQDKLYRKYFSQKKQEARLYLACVAALCLPTGMFIFAWTALPEIHWMVPIAGLTVFMSSVIVIYQVGFLYLVDCYDTYASSAQAGHILSRNLMALIFPLFAPQLFAALTYKWALTLFAVVALVMSPTPFVFFLFGSQMRARSIASREIFAADAPSLYSSASASSLPPSPSDLGSNRV